MAILVKKNKSRGQSDKLKDCPLKYKTYGHTVIIMNNNITIIEILYWAIRYNKSWDKYNVKKNKSKLQTQVKLLLSY